MALFFIAKQDFFKVLKGLSGEAEIFAPLKINEHLHLEKINPETIKEILLDVPRTVGSAKDIFFRSRETVAKYFRGRVQADERKPIIIGVSGCDLRAIQAVDKFYFMDDSRETFYEGRRGRATIISTDCNFVHPTCFCNMVEGSPYGESGFDINLSEARKGLVVEIGSAKGEEIKARFNHLFRDATLEEIDERKTNREKAMRLLEAQNKRYRVKISPKEILEGNPETAVWRNLSRKCVECGSCNTICPTCTCFLLCDESVNSNFERVKTWDSCMKAGYARVAGGANPRAKLFQRLNNRFQCKFNLMREKLGVYTCVGCGRCIDGCPADIDVREALESLEANLPLTAKLE
ncbi:MAG: 4Fe-4S dicluster domain-containing protein [Candidatus Saganbacteria bacterium]|nr:4Fe-4S dicluster domain-containing protein [Candidatus Saganbacteria bacterium]